jgi:hypothetical protein
MPSPGAGMRPHRGAMILVFGILSWVLCFIFGIVAWVMGSNDLRAMAAGEMDPSGEGLTKAGKIIGMIHIILCIITIPLMIILFAMGAFAAAATAGASGGG